VADDVGERLTALSPGYGLEESLLDFQWQFRSGRRARWPRESRRLGEKQARFAGVDPAGAERFPVASSRFFDQLRRAARPAARPRGAPISSSSSPSMMRSIL